MNPGSLDQYQPRPAAVKTCHHPLNTLTAAYTVEMQVSESLRRIHHDLHKGHCAVTTQGWCQANAETSTACPELEPGLKVHHCAATHKLCLCYFCVTEQKKLTATLFYSPQMFNSNTDPPHIFKQKTVQGQRKIRAKS